ncbi:MAG: hypothetical protein HLX50_18305 [Alteromonadaceae bacterium]|nr:hypothetical protein [Alteromonadaceae bacterium]
MQTAKDNEYIIQDFYMAFRDRCKEVKKFVDFVSLLAGGNYEYVASVDVKKSVVNPLMPIERDLEKTLRSSGLLLLYNLVEATMSNAIDGIHRAVVSEGLSYHELTDNMRKITAAHFRRAVNGNVEILLDENDHPIKHAMVYVGYDKTSLFSGNIDCRAIRIEAKKYGFKSPDPNAKNRGIGHTLFEIRDKRNALAHGRSSFEECGQDISPDALPVMAHQTMVYLRAILWSISYFIRHSQYKAA